MSKSKSVRGKRKVQAVVRRKVLREFLDGLSCLWLAMKHGLTIEQVEAVVREGWTPRNVLRKRGWTMDKDGLMHPPNTQAGGRS